MATAKEFNLKFKWQQETKGAVRFGEVLPDGSIALAPNDPGAVVGTLYIRKSAFAPHITFPKEVSLIITA